MNDKKLFSHFIDINQIIYTSLFIYAFIFSLLIISLDKDVKSVYELICLECFAGIGMYAIPSFLSGYFIYRWFLKKGNNKFDCFFVALISVPVGFAITLLLFKLIT